MVCAWSEYGRQRAGLAMVNARHGSQHSRYRDSIVITVNTFHRTRVIALDVIKKGPQGGASALFTNKLSVSSPERLSFQISFENKKTNQQTKAKWNLILKTCPWSSPTRYIRPYTVFKCMFDVVLSWFGPKFRQALYVDICRHSLIEGSFSKRDIE